MNPLYTNQKQIRVAFWESHPTASRKRIKHGEYSDYVTDTRRAFVDFVDFLHREGMISDSLAHRVTL